MFNSLSGEITGTAANLIYIATGGVEWEVEVSTTTLRELARETRARVLTHLVHREDMMRLYGFATEVERRVFLELISVSGIGPRAALKMLSGSTPERMVIMLQSEDVDALTQLPGLGKKTAQKIILALRGRLVRPDDSGSAAESEVVAALVEMGFDRGAATRAVQQLSAALEEPNESVRERELLRQAIVALSTDQAQP